MLAALAGCGPARYADVQPQTTEFIAPVPPQSQLIDQHSSSRRTPWLTWVAPEIPLQLFAGGYGYEQKAV